MKLRETIRQSLVAIAVGVAGASWGMSALATPVKNNCLPYDARTESPLTRKPLVIEQRQELDQEITENYAAENRLKGRAYRNPSETVTVSYGNRPIPVSENFISGMSGHIAKALREEWVDGITYSDMGHMHLMLPTPEYEDLKTSEEDRSARMIQILASPELQALYHTAEMVKLKDGDFARGTVSTEPWKAHRYATRNLLGSFVRGGDDYPLDVLMTAINDTYNTVRSIAGMTEVSTMYFSANKNGCFQAVAPDGRALGFDITFEEIPYENSATPALMF